MTDRFDNNSSRRKFLRQSAVGGLGLIGFSTQAAAGSPPGAVHFARAGYEHTVDFSSLPSSTFKSKEELLEAAIEQSDASRAELEQMDPEERKRALSFPGDRSELVDPEISGVNIDVPASSVSVRGNELQVPGKGRGLPDVVANNDVVVDRAANGLGRKADPTRNAVVTALASPTRPTKALSVAPGASYTPPGFDVRSARGDGSVEIRTEAGAARVNANTNAAIEQSSRTVDLQLRTYDGSLTTASVRITPTLRIENHGIVSPKTGGRGP